MRSSCTNLRMSPDLNCKLYQPPFMTVSTTQLCLLRSCEGCRGQVSRIATLHQTSARKKHTSLILTMVPSSNGFNRFDVASALSSTAAAPPPPLPTMRELQHQSGSPCLRKNFR